MIRQHAQSAGRCCGGMVDQARNAGRLMRAAKGTGVPKATAMTDHAMVLRARKHRSRGSTRGSCKRNAPVIWIISIGRIGNID